MIRAERRRELKKIRVTKNDAPKLNRHDRRLLEKQLRKDSKLKRT